MMKKITQIALVAILISCGKNPTEPTNSTTQNASTPETPLAAAAEQMAGTWVDDNFLENIKKTKSVYPNRESKTKVLFFTLDKNELLKGAALLKGFTAQEGGYDVQIKFDEAKKEFAKDEMIKVYNADFTESFELKMNGSNKLEMVLPNKTDVYQKINNDLPTELRKVLFEGSYNEKNGKSKVTFGNDGKTNFKGYSKYDVIYSFVDGIQKFDGILLYKANSTNPDIYQFTIKGNILELQYIHENESERTLKAEGEKVILTKD
jgi:hypothetical protein